MWLLENLKSYIYGSHVPIRDYWQNKQTKTTRAGMKYGDGE